MRQRLLRGDHAFAQQEFHMAVIASALEHFSPPQQIDPAVADVCPVRAAVLHQAHGAGGARPCLDRQAGAELHDFLVRASERQVQETERIQDGLRRVPERFDQHLDGGFSRLGAIGMAAHAVDHDEQRGVLGDRD
jgi:hypothetical protein